MKKKFFYFIGVIFIIIYLLMSKPFIEYNKIDYSIYKNIMRLVSFSLLFLSIFNISKVKKKSIINFIIIFITIISSIYLYNGHSKDYKTRTLLYFKKSIKIDKSISASTVSYQEKTNDIETLSDETLRVNYIDVGQGDSIFIELPNDETMLIDAGEKTVKDKVINYIKNLGYKKIDYVIGTHPHTDHIGALSAVIKEFDIGKIYMPKKESTSKTFLELLNTIKDKNLKINTAKSGVVIKDEKDLQIKIIAPSKEYNNTNNSSAVVKLKYKNKIFLFMGDAEVDSEKDIEDSVLCDVIKVAHHGSDTSSSEEFVKKTKAKYAIISVGANNIYNHPYNNIIKRWQDIGAKVLRTDELKDIVLKTDGNKIEVENNIKNTKKKNENIELISVSAKRGKNGQISVRGIPNSKYSIEVYISSGKSKSKDLSDKISDNNGYVSWTWKISSNTKIGKYKIIIKNDSERQEFEYEIE